MGNIFLISGWFCPLLSALCIAWGSIILWLSLIILYGKLSPSSSAKCIHHTFFIFQVLFGEFFILFLVFWETQINLSSNSKWFGNFKEIHCSFLKAVGTVWKSIALFWRLWILHKYLHWNLSLSSGFFQYYMGIYCPSGHWKYSMGNYWHFLNIYREYFALSGSFKYWNNIYFTLCEVHKWNLFPSSSRLLAITPLGWREKNWGTGFKWIWIWRTKPSGRSFQ